MELFGCLEVKFALHTCLFYNGQLAYNGMPLLTIEMSQRCGIIDTYKRENVWTTSSTKPRRLLKACLYLWLSISSHFFYDDVTGTLYIYSVLIRVAFHFHWSVEAIIAIRTSIFYIDTRQFITAENYRFLLKTCTQFHYFISNLRLKSGGNED